KAAAYLAFERSIAVPGLPPEIRREAEQKMALLAQALPTGSAAATATARPATILPDAGSAVRDETGLQPGAALGIVSASLRDGQAGTKNLRVAIKARPGKRIDVSKMNVMVYFYELDASGEILLTESQPSTQWISPPVDWADSEPEILDVEYWLPEARASSDPAAGSRRFHGYVVAVYYNGELQDSRADPGRLVNVQELPLYLEQEDLR
ncbi:MAG: hypothetical protein N2322_08165, partial [Terrimicrobiaceae bacterium]|nr:hypothetical protein [Terrimicrobiaceae bacterium]